MLGVRDSSAIMTVGSAIFQMYRRKYRGIRRLPLYFGYYPEWFGTNRIEQFVPKNNQHIKMAPYLRAPCFCLPISVR